MMPKGSAEVPKSLAEATTLCCRLVNVAEAVPMSLFPGRVCSQLEAGPKLSFPGKECSPGAEEESTKMSHMA